MGGPVVGISDTLEGGLAETASEGPGRTKGWLLIAKSLPSADEKQARAVRSRISSRFAAACKVPPTLPSCLFIRACLSSFPAFRDLHKDLYDPFLDSLIEAVLDSEDVLLRRITLELWSSGATTQRIERALDSLRETVNEGGKTVSETRLEKGILMLNILTDCIAYAAPNSSVGVSLMEVLGVCLDRPGWSHPSLALLSSLIRHAAWTAAPLAKKLCQTLVRLPPSRPQLEALFALVETFGPSSHVHSHLAVLFNALPQPQPEEYADAGTRLLASIFERAGHLIDGSVLSCVAASICSSALRHPLRPFQSRLISALLSHGNDAVPVPLHVARTLIRRLPPGEERQMLQMKADAVARPRTYALGLSTVMRAMERVEREAMEEKRVRPITLDQRDFEDGKGRIEESDEEEQELHLSTLQRELALYEAGEDEEDFIMGDEEKEEEEKEEPPAEEEKIAKSEKKNKRKGKKREMEGDTEDNQKKKKKLTKGQKKALKMEQEMNEKKAENERRLAEERSRIEQEAALIKQRKSDKVEERRKIDKKEKETKARVNRLVIEKKDGNSNRKEEIPAPVPSSSAASTSTAIDGAEPTVQEILDMIVLE